MRTDRELLELAAKAVGYVVDEDFDRLCKRESGGAPMRWRPLEDDGDAFRLMASLKLVVHVWHDADQVSAAKTLPGGDDPPSSGETWHCATAHAQGGIEAAARRAIVLAAAEIGARMP